MSFDVQNEEIDTVRQTAGDFPLVKFIDENNEENREQNFRIKDYETLLADGRVKVEQEACLGAELNFSTDCQSATLDDQTLINNNESLVNGDIYAYGANQAETIVPTDVKFEIDEKCVDDDTFELRILDDDENEIQEMKYDSNVDPIAVPDECSLRQQRSKPVSDRSYLSADSDSAAVSETVDNAGEVQNSTPVIAAVATLRTNGHASRGGEAAHNCVWCPKQFPSRKSLKCHILWHLKILKQNAKDGHPASETANATADDVEADASSDLACVFCEKSFPGKKAVIAHYVDVHRHPDSQLQNRPKRTALNGPYWQPCENKVPDVPTSAPIVSSSAKESSTARNVDENGTNDDTKQYKCYLCDKQFSRNSSLVWHIQFHETYKYPKFEKNNSEPDTQSSAEVGTNGATDDVQECDDSISSAGTSDKCTCNICNLHFTNRSNFLQHMNSAHPANGDQASSFHQKTAGHKCDSCGKFFSTSSNMRKHARKHCKGPLAVPESEEEEDNSEDDNENDNEDPLKDFHCHICDRSFISQRALSIHRSSKHRDESSDTAASDTRIDELIPCDSYAETDNGCFRCNVCEKLFQTRKGVIRHIGYHRSTVNDIIKPDTPSLNGTSDDDSDNANEEEDSVPCPECGKTFSSLRGMRIHANKHSAKNDSDTENDDNDIRNQSSFECPTCSKTFEGFRSYKIHIGWHSRREETPVISSKKSEKSKPVIVPQKKSEKSETAVTPQKKPERNTPISFPSAHIHQCPQCPRRYNTQQALAGHMKVHLSLSTGTPQGSDQPQVKAHQSSKTATPQGSHPAEIQILQKKTEICQVCGKIFSSNSNLNEHMRLHATEAIPATSSGQPLTLDDTMECDMCGKFFMRKQDMAKHMRDHMNGALTQENTDLSLFRCIHCPKSFIGRKSLMTHQRLHREAQRVLKRVANQLLADTPPAKQCRLSDLTVSAENDFVGWDNMIQGHQCEKCDRILSTKQSLRRHMEWHTKMRELHGIDALLKNEAKSASAAAKQELAGTWPKEPSCAPDGGPETVVVNELEALGEHAVIQCVESGIEDYFIFEQDEAEAYQCSECDDTHVNKLQMLVHMAHHVGKRQANGHQASLIIKANPITLAPFECMFCEERFVNKVFRKHHVVERHGNDVLHCNLCTKLFLKKKKLEAHCQKHLSDPVYRCERCLKCFTSKWFLKRHERKICVDQSVQEIKEEQGSPMVDVESSND